MNIDIKIHSTNRKAKFDYELQEEYTAGLKLRGSEVKSIKGNHCSLKESYISIDAGKVYLKQMLVPRLQTSPREHEEIRNIELLLNKSEIQRLHQGVTRNGYSIIPYRIFTIKGLIKVDIFLAKGKKLYDKRESIKSRDLGRELGRELKCY